MVNRGLALPGLVVPTVQGGVNGGVPGATVASVQSSVQTVTTQLSPNRYEPIVVEKGIPVTWTIQAQAGDINGCNNEIILPAFNEQLALSPGNNVLVFTPTETGTFGYSCWMGMIRSSITVVDDIDEVKAYDFNDQNPTFLTKK
jgi:plastocyanin domain-containing protein